MKIALVLISAVVFRLVSATASIDNDGLNSFQNKHVETTVTNITTLVVQEKHIHVQETVSSQNETRKAEEILGRFVEQLKSYIKETNFDVSGFEKTTGRLKKEFQIIVETFDALPPSEDLTHQLTVAKRVFQAMIDATWYFNHYKNFSSVGHHLVYKLIELSVRVLALQNSHGELDVHIDGYVSELTRLRDSFNFWDGRFKLLRHVSFEVLSVYYRNFNGLDQTLRVLASQIPKQEREISSVEPFSTPA
ncbi:hypothetical protein JCM33374_g1334 [Metschnikowia sp. JCM 33374]|nr:hypothetical protein JCM33374_g1334 [Metschnikowia sp. JCM 33374]